MTKETKIGLLVGLAFIILFAIILSEKSGTHDAGLPQFAQADNARKVGPVTGAEKPLHDAGRLPVDTKLPPPGEPRPAPVKTVSAAKPAVEPPQSSKDQSQPLETESLARLLNPPDEPAGGTEKSKETPSVSLGEAVAIALESKDAAPPPIVPKTDPPVEKTASALKPADSSPDLTTTEPPSTKGDSHETASADRPSKPAGNLPIKATHEVQPGESLGKIAAKYYGRSTPQRVEAIYNANRDAIPSVNAVKASTKLNIPDLGENNDQFEAASPFSGTQLADARKVGLDDKVIVPLPIGDRMQPEEKQRGPGSTGRVASAAPEKATAEKAPSEKGAVEKAPTASDKEAAGKTSLTSKKGAAEKASPSEKETAAKPKASKPAADSRSGKPAKPEKPAAEKAKSDKPATDPKYQWYEVQESDTLGKIAARKLGDQKYYSEILRLNKDRISDKNMLTPGVKIRLPARTGTAGSQTEATASATKSDNT
jgi:nucleoid-associated protein YgaU